MRCILILCTGNSARSQVAEGYLQTFAGEWATVYNAGVAPHGVNPLAIQTSFRRVRDQIKAYRLEVIQSRLTETILH